MFSRAIKIIVLSSLVFVLGVNLVAFTIAQSPQDTNGWVVIQTAISNHGSDFKFRGFKYFMDYISTFPGLTNSLNMINYGLNLLSGQGNFTTNNVLDAVIGIFYMLLTPITLFITFVLDVLNNIIWIFGFFIPNFI